MALSTASDARAQQAQGPPSGFQLEHFEPLAWQGHNKLGLMSAQLPEHAQLAFGALGHLSADPLVLSSPQRPQEVTRVIGAQAKMELLGGVGLWGWLEVGLALPVVVYQRGDARIDPSQAIPEGAALADPRLTLRAALLAPDQDLAPGLGVALGLGVHLPLGDQASLNSDGTLRVEPRLVVDWRHASGLWAGVNLGYQALRAQPRARNFNGGDAVRMGLGVQVPVGLTGVSLLGTVSGLRAVGAWPTSASEDAATTSPAEAQLVAQVLTRAGLQVQVGAGLGVNDSIGSPAWRAILGISYAPGLALGQPEQPASPATSATDAP